MPRSKDISIGVNYPIERSEDGFFAKTYTSLEEIKVNILNALSTRKGERVMKPNFGSNLHLILFEQSTRDIELAVEEEIESTIERWVPQADLQSVSVDREQAENAILTEITFTTSFLPDNKEENLELWLSSDEQ